MFFFISWTAHHISIIFIVVWNLVLIIRYRDYGRKINVWSTNKYSNELHTAVSVIFSVPSSVQSKNCWKTALIYSFTADPTERGWGLLVYPLTSPPSTGSSFPPIFTLHWRRYTECYWNCNMQFIWLFIGASNVDFSPIIIYAKHCLTNRCFKNVLFYTKWNLVALTQELH